MTSEVLLMNLEAAVLGADSAATMFDAQGRPFSQSGVEKIFIINESAPVAAMVYGGGAFAGYPWKTVLDDFARKCGPKPLAMNVYTERLLDYLAHFGEGGDLKLEPEIEQDLFSLYLCLFLLDYRQWLEILGWTPKMPLTGERVTAALTVYSRQVLYLDPENADQDQLTPRPRAPSSDRLQSFLVAHFGKSFAREMGRVFAGTAFPESELDALAKLAMQSLLVEWLPFHAQLFSTGLVMAGFGAGASVPSMASLTFFGPFGGIVKYSSVHLKTPRATDPVMVETFAQADLTHAFLYGAMPAYEDDAFRVMAHLLSDLAHTVVGEAATVSKPLAQKLAGLLQDVPYQVPNIAVHVARRVRYREVQDKLWPQVNAANAEMLGQLAQKFMALPILEHELLREESVGRPVVVLTLKPGRYTFIRDGGAS